MQLTNLSQLAPAVWPAFNHIPDGVVIAAPNGYPAFINLRGRQLLGIPVDAPLSAELLENLRVLHPDKTTPIALEELPCMRALRGEDVDHCEMYVRYEDGREAWLSTNARQMRHEGGSVAGAISVIRDITEQKRLERSLRESELRFRNAMKYASIGMALVGLDGRWLNVNEALCRLFGYPLDELVAKTFQDITHPDDLEADLACAKQLLDGEAASYQLEKRYIRKDGNIVHGILGVSLVRDESGQPLYFMAQIQDITERKTMEQELRESEELTRKILMGSHDAFISVAEDGIVLEWNQRAEAVFGWTRDEAVGRDVTDLIIPERYRSSHREGLQRFRHKDPAERRGWKLEVTAIGKTGYEFPAEATVSPMLVKGSYIFHTFFHDISQRKHMEDRLINMAQYDALTRLPNRRLFFDKLHRAISHSRKNDHGLALLFMDLNNFKQINDMYGHAAGDQVLIAFAERVKSCLRKMDTFARLAGDEFVIIVEDLEMPGGAVVVAKKVLGAMQAPLLIEGAELTVTPSIGIALLKEDDTAESLTKRSDQAMYRAKQHKSQDFIFAE